MATEKKKITLTRALAELKLLEARIEQAYINKLFIGVTVGKGNSIRVANSNFTSLSVSQLEEEIKGNWNRAIDLIKYRTALKSAIMKANAGTTVTVGQETYTIAEALERKKSIKIEENFLNHVRAHGNSIQDSYEKLVTNLNTAIENDISKIYGSDRTKISEDAAKLVRDQREAIMSPGIVDPIDLRKKLEERIEAVRLFLTEIDVALSEVNASTVIEFEA